MAVAGGICGGKEGPLVHIGSMIGVYVAYLPFKMFSYFRNDTDKRNFMAFGMGAGISVAFGSPIGGSLFAYEISKPSTFYILSTAWRGFFACSISVFFLSILKNLESGKGISIEYAGLIKLGRVEQ